MGVGGGNDDPAFKLGGLTALSLDVSLAALMAASFATVMMVAFMRNASPAFDCNHFITTQSTLLNESIAGERGPRAPKFARPISRSSAFRPMQKFWIYV